VLAKYYEHVTDVLMAEAMAAHDGLALARACGYEKVMLEVDNITLVNLLHSAAGIRSLIAGIWHEISEFGMNFNSFSVSFVNREGNEAAHVCAKLASEASRECEWSIPSLRG
jgi:ribonuclease HI